MPNLRSILYFRSVIISQTVTNYLNYIVKVRVSNLVDEFGYSIKAHLTTLLKSRRQNKLPEATQ